MTDKNFFRVTLDAEEEDDQIMQFYGHNLLLPAVSRFARGCTWGGGWRNEVDENHSAKSELGRSLFSTVIFEELTRLVSNK